MLKDKWFINLHKFRKMFFLSGAMFHPQGIKRSLMLHMVNETFFNTESTV